MKRSDLAPLRAALKELRRVHQMTQDDLAADLGISRKTYLLFESTRWLPQARARPHLVKRLHELHPPTARLFAELMGESLDHYIEVRPVVVAPPLPPGAEPALPLEAAHAKLVLDSAILGVAEQLDMSPRLLRPIVAVLLDRLAAAGMPMGQAATIARTPARPLAVSADPA